MTDADATRKLVRLTAGLTRTEPDGSAWIDLYEDPSTIESIGTLIAGSVTDADVNAAVSWLDPDETVLAHAVASKIPGAVRAAADDDLGLLKLVPGIPDRSTVLLVATRFTQFRSSDALRRAIEHAGHTVVGVVDLSSEPHVRVHAR